MYSNAVFKGERITFLLNKFPNSSETFITDEIECLIKQGCEVRIFSLEKPDSILHKNAQQIVESGIVTYLDTPKKYRKLIELTKLCLNPFKLLAYIKLRLPRWYKLQALVYWHEISKASVSHIHCHYAAHSSLIAYAINAFAKVDYSITTHGYDVFFGPPDNYVDLATNAKAVFAVSDFNRAYLIDKHSLPSHKVVTSRCGIDVTLFSDFTVKPISTGEAIEIVCVARLHPVKGHDLLFEALARLIHNDNMNLKLSLIGDGKLHSELKHLSRKLQIEEHVTFKGFLNQEETRSNLKSSHIFVLSSRSEGIPLSMMEAMASMTPVIGPDVNGVSELVSNDNEGILFTPGSVDSLYEAIKEMIERKSEFDNITKCAHQKVMSNHLLTANTVKKYSRLFNQ
ncbi:glycosyltransferase family 4 protein [Thalassotalea montiporae]